MDQRPQALDEQYLDRMHILAAITKSDAGISFLRWLHGLTGFSKPSMTMEDAARRDIWLSIRPYIEVSSLARIEHHELGERQKQMYEIISTLTEESNDV